MTSRARRRYTDEQRLALLARYQRSDLSGPSSADGRGFVFPRFSLWGRSADAAGRGRPRRPGFAEVRLSAPAAASTVTLHLPSGAKLEVATGPDAINGVASGLLLKSLHS